MGELISRRPILPLTRKAFKINDLGGGQKWFGILPENKPQVIDGVKEIRSYLKNQIGPNANSDLTIPVFLRREPNSPHWKDYDKP
jgi:hypothetical protein